MFFRLCVFGIFGLFLCVGCQPKDKIKIVCIGDEITVGATQLDASVESYPALLNKQLGSQYEVLNFGTQGAAISNGKNFSKTIIYGNINTYQPNIIVLMLGTNDTKPNCINHSIQELKVEYLSIIQTLQKLKSNPQIYLCTPICAFQNNIGVNDALASQKIAIAIRDIAQAESIQMIDLRSIFPENQSLLIDNVYPTKQGNEIMAKAIVAYITTTWTN